MAYATIDDLASYMGVPVADLAPESARLLTLAQELIDYTSMNRVDVGNAALMDKVKSATCAQVEYWLETGDPNGIVSQSTRMGFGSFSMDGSLSLLGPRVRQILSGCGLLFRGVTQTARQSLRDTFFKRQGDY